MSYDFMTLSPSDFEAIVADLFSRLWKVRLESFKEGTDGGVDLRHACSVDGNEDIVIQCKRYAPHKLSNLVSDVKKEKKKLQVLEPSRYVLATTVGLTPGNKETLLKVLRPWCKGPGDIVGPTELNILL